MSLAEVSTSQMPRIKHFKFHCICWCFYKQRCSAVKLNAPTHRRDAENAELRREIDHHGLSLRLHHPQVTSRRQLRSYVHPLAPAGHTKTSSKRSSSRSAR